MTWHTTKYIRPILGICALHLTHPKCTHTQQWTQTHTMSTHPEQWAAFYAATPGEQLRVRCLAQGHISRGIEDGESAGYSFPPLQFLLARDSNLQPFDYKSDSNHFDTTSHWGYHKCLWYKSYIYTHINTFSTLFSTILYNLSYRNTNIPYILPKIIEGNYLKAHKWTIFVEILFSFLANQKKNIYFLYFCSMKILQFGVLTFLSDFLFLYSLLFPLQFALVFDLPVCFKI